MKKCKKYIYKNPIPYIALRGRNPFRACFLRVQILIVLRQATIGTWELWICATFC